MTKDQSIDSELTEKARIVKDLFQLQGSPNSSAIAKEVDLWAVADYITSRTKSAVEAAKKTSWDECAFHIAGLYQILSAKDFRNNMAATIAEIKANKESHE